MYEFYYIICLFNKYNIIYDRYAVVFHNEWTKCSVISTKSYLIFNEDGDIINRWTTIGRVLRPIDYEVLGHRLFRLDSDDKWFVKS